MNKGKNAVMTFCVLFLLVYESHDVCGQTGSVKSNEKRITIQMFDTPLFDVFGRLINKYGIPIGFEESILDREHDDYLYATNIWYDETVPRDDGKMTGISALRPIIEHHLITVDFKNASLRTVLSEIVGQMKYYDWKIDNGVVNIFPKKGRDPKFRKLLGLKIHRFRIRKNTEVGRIRDLIFQLPEFKVFLKETGLRTDSARIGSWFEGRSLRNGTKFSDLTFKDLLNEITKFKGGGWILKSNKQLRNEKKSENGSIDVLI